MEKHEKDPKPLVGPPAPEKPADAPADAPHPGRPPHWHEGDPEPGEEDQHLPPKDDAD